MRHERIRGLVRPLAVVATVVMFLVLIMGATVTNTGSAEGCGRSWPLCHGKFIPEFAVSTLIEYSHRLVTGAEGFLIMAVGIGAWWMWRQRREIRFLVPLMVFVLLLQSGLGAWAVLYPQTPLVMALHFGVSLTAFASVLLTAVFLYEVGGRERLRDRPIPSRLRWYVWGIIGYTYLLVYLGAYVRHSNASLACLDWPLCNGQVIPELSGPVGVVFLHRVAALLATFLVVGLVVWTRRLRADRPDLFWGSVAALVLILIQSLSGALIVETRMNLYSSLTHAGLITLLFGVLSYLCLHVLPLPSPRGARAPSGRTRPAATLEVGSSVER